MVRKIVFHMKHLVFLYKERLPAPAYKANTQSVDHMSQGVMQYMEYYLY